MKQKKEKIEGVIYAVPVGIAINLFERGKDIFVKYSSHEPTKKTKIKLDQGKKVYIYVSGKNKSIIGEAKIKKVEHLIMAEIIKKYKKRLIMSKSELEIYSEGREMKKAQIFELDKPRLYPVELKVSVPITMQGTYITNLNKKDIFEK
jgi:hypothetical protein